MSDLNLFQVKTIRFSEYGEITIDEIIDMNPSSRMN